MKKSFSLSVFCLVILAFLTGLSSCSGMMQNLSLRTGTVSFSLDKAVFDAARSGDYKESEPGYLVKISLKDRRGNEIVENVNISWQDYEKCRETDRKMTTSIPKVPVGKKYTAYVKIFRQEPEKEKDHDINPVNDPTLVEEEFERVPEIFGKSEEFTVKSGKNEVILYAYNFIHGFDFSVTLNFEENEAPNIQTYLSDMRIRAYASDSPAAARLTGLKDDKYEMYDFMGEYFEMEGELSPYSSEANFSLNPDKKSATAKGKIYLPVDVNDPANSGEEVLLAAMVYNYDNPEMAKPVLFGKTGPVTPKRGQTASSTISLKTLDIVNTPVILYEDGYAARDFYKESKDNPLNIVGDYETNFCFDNNGFVYTLVGSYEYQLAYDLQTNNPGLTNVTIRNHRGSDWDFDTIVVDLKTNILYSYYIKTSGNEPVIMLYAYPALYPVTNQDEVIEGNEITVGPFTDSNSGEKLTPEYLTIYDNRVFIIAKDGSEEKYFFTMSLIQENGESQGKKLELPEGNITDMLYMDGAIYLVISDYFFPSELHKNNPIHSRGAVAKYDITTGQIKVLGDTKEATPTDTGKIYLCHYLSDYFIYDFEDHSLPITLSKDYVFPNGQTGPVPNLFPDLYAPVNNPNAFRNPTKIIAIKPKKLVIADDGLFFYTDNDAWNFKNSNRIIVVDLENFSIESIDTTSAKFEKQVTQHLDSGSSYGSIASSYFGTDSINHTLLQVYDSSADNEYYQQYIDSGGVPSDVCGAFKNSDLD